MPTLADVAIALLALGFGAAAITPLLIDPRTRCGRRTRRGARIR